MAPIQMSMLSGVPYSFRNFLAKPLFFSTWLSSATFRGWESPQKRRQALYPEGEEGRGSFRRTPAVFLLASAALHNFS